MDALLGARAALLQALLMPGYGLELIARVRGRTAGLVRLRMGSVYPALRRLEKAGLVRSEIIAARVRAGRPRKYYELTPRGVMVAMAEREALAGMLRVQGQRPPAQDLERVRERLRRCASVSASVSKLRRRALEAQGLE